MNLLGPGVSRTYRFYGISHIAKAKHKGTSPATSTMPEQIHEFKRNQVLNEAAALFYDEGYHSTTLSAIAQRLGVTKPFIYYHFENKAEILAELCRPTIEKVNQALDEALATEGSTATRLYKAIVAITEATLQDQKITTIYFREEKNFTADAIAEINQMRKSFDNKLRILLDEGIDKEEFHVVDSRFCRSEEHTSELQSLMRISYAVFCLKKKIK